MKGGSKKTTGIVGEALLLSRFEALVGELKPWRAPKLRKLEEEKGSGLVLGFVKGLRLSAGLIYVLRNTVAGNGLKVHWGHLLDPNEDSCSPECDVIIHRGHCDQWNGHDEPVMDFKFIKCEEAVAVISCKSFARAIDAEYPRKLKPYMKTVFVFSECCAPGKVTALGTRAKKAGYRGFACLYTYDEATGECVNLPGEWKKFVSEILKVVNRASSRTK